LPQFIEGIAKKITKAEETKEQPYYVRKIIGPQISCINMVALQEKLEVMDIERATRPVVDFS